MRLLTVFVVTAITRSYAMAADLSNPQVDSIKFRSLSGPGLDPINAVKAGDVRLTWRELRSADFNISTESRDGFMRSIKDYVWRMLCGHLLTSRVEEVKLVKLPTVVEQMGSEV